MGLADRVNNFAVWAILLMILVFSSRLFANEIITVGSSSCDSLKFYVDNNSYCLCFSNKYFDTSKLSSITYRQDVFHVFESKQCNGEVFIIYIIQDKRYLKGVLLSFNSIDRYKAFCKSNRYHIIKNNDTLVNDRTKIVKIKELHDLPTTILEKLEKRKLNYILSTNFCNKKNNAFRKKEMMPDPNSGKKVDSLIQSIVPEKN